MPPDQNLKRRVFWAVILLSAAGIIAGHWVEAHFCYDVDEWLNTRYGSFGASLIRCPPHSEDSRYVVILGNSVYQAHRIVHNMDQFAEQDHRAIQFVNLSLTGAGISDYVLQAADAIRHKPDLVVIGLAECTFQKLGPTFRSDVDQRAFEPGLFKSVPWSFYLRQFNLKTAGASVVASVFPLARLDPILRFKLTRIKPFPQLLSRHIHFPRLNLVANFRIRERGRARLAAGRTGPRAEDYRETVADLLEVLKRGETRALFILQENDATPLADETMAVVKEVVSQYDFATVADFSSLWDPDLFGDRIHPKPEYREDYARRHYEAICAVLDSR